MKKIDLESISFFIILLISTFPLLPKAIESILMLLFFLLSIFIFFKQGKQKYIHSKNIIILSSIFVIYCLGCFFRENDKENLNFAIRVAPIFMFVISLGYLSPNIITESRLKIIKKVYLLSIFLSLIITHLYLKFTIVDEATSWEYRNAFEDFTQVHGTYFSLWIGFGLLILINNYVVANNFYKTRNLLKGFIITSTILYLIYWQVIIAARLPLFVTGLLISHSFIKNQKKSTQKKVLIVSGLAICLFMYFNYDRIKEKIKFNMPEGKYELKHKSMTSEEIRAGIYYCSVSLIKESWLFGYGAGNVNDKLNNCYKEKINSDVYQTFYFNSHNQYLQVFLAGGIIGLLFFLTNIFYIFKVSFLRRDKLFFYFSILISICFLTENILSRHDGVIFYAFFSSVFFFNKKYH